MTEPLTPSERDERVAEIRELETGTAEYKAMLARNEYPVNFGEKARGVAGVTLPVGSRDAIDRLVRDVEAFGYGCGEAPPRSSEQLQWLERSATAKAKLSEHVAFLLDELEAARKDSERLDWMERTGAAVSSYCHADEQGWYAAPRTHHGEHAIGDTVREAIDAAISGSTDERDGGQHA